MSGRTTPMPSAENDAGGEQRFNTCPKCGQPVPAPFRAHVENLGGCPETAVVPPGGTDDVGYALQDVLNTHRYVYERKGSKPDDPGWHECTCGWEGYWSGFHNHVANHLRFVATAPPAGSDVTQEYGLRIDCKRNGCTEPHGDDGMVLPRGIESEAIERVNGHAVTFVVRDVTRSPWRDLVRDTNGPELPKCDHSNHNT